MKKLLTVSTLIIVPALFFLFFYLKKDSIDVIQTKTGPAVQAVYAAGTVEATQMIPLAPRVASRISKLLVDEGDLVNKGDVLVLLENKDLELVVEELKARQEFAKLEFDRQKTLLAKNVSSTEEFQRAQSELLASEAALAAAMVRAEYLEIKAPLDGKIIKRDGEAGQFIPLSQNIFWLAGTGPLRISAEVDEEDIAQIEPGQEVLIRADAFAQSTFKGSVAQITPKGDEVARSYRVRIALLEETPLQIGMTVENNIIVREISETTLLPTSAVLQNAVWILEEGRLQLEEVRVGARGLDRVEILSGITGSTLVIAEPDSELEEGQARSARLREWNLE